jgi:hypothetical protein
VVPTSKPIILATTKKPVKVTKKPVVPPPTPWPTNIGRFVPVGNLIVLGGEWKKKSYLTTQAAISANGSVVAFPGNISVYRLNHNDSHWDPIGMFYYTDSAKVMASRGLLPCPVTVVSLP